MRSRWARRIAVGVLAGCLPYGVAQGRRVYVDRANEVSFSYPAGWTLNGDDDAATAKLRVALAASAKAVVTLEGNFADTGPYKGTEFEAGAFAYAVVPGGTEATCFETLEQEKQDPVVTMWHGLRARRLETTYSVAGTNDSHEIVAVFRGERCYQFETVIVSHSPDLADKPLSAVRWKGIRTAFDGVMESVRIGGAGDQ